MARARGRGRDEAAPSEAPGGRARLEARSDPAAPVPLARALLSPRLA